MLDSRTQAVVEDANDIIDSHKTKFVIEAEHLGTHISYAGEPLVWIGDDSSKLIHIIIHNEDIRTELGMLFGEMIWVTKPIVHLIVDRVLHSSVVCKMLYEQVTKEDENDKN